MARDPIWDALKEHSKAKFDADRKRFMTDAHLKDDGGWKVHTKWHWSRYVNGKKLDYWPSRMKFQYDGKVRRGDVYRFIAKLISTNAEKQDD